MIVDLDRFIAEERSYWSELEEVLLRLERDPGHRMDVAQVKRFHYLYQRSSADLVKIKTFCSEPEIRRYLDSLVARAYGEIHETREKPHRLAPWHWFFTTLPRTFRRHVRTFWLSVAITLVGCAFGVLAVTFDPEAKEVIMPFPHLRGDPSERVAQEEVVDQDRLAGRRTSFSVFLMTHNAKVSIFAMALGVTWGIGTAILLFINGVILGAVVLDYVMAGETMYVVGWLLPHGAVEIPAILLAGQAGLVLAGALIGWGEPLSLGMGLRSISGDLVTLIFGVVVMLVWAGLVEAFLSQYHEPLIPYELKIGFGVVEIILLALLLGKCGERREGEEA